MSAAAALALLGLLAATPGSVQSKPGSGPARPRPPAGATVQPKPPPREPSRFAIGLGGGLAALPLDWQADTSFTLHAETARVSASHEASLGPTAELAIALRVAPRVSVQAAIGWSRRDTSAAIEAELPHPLYLERPRGVSGRAEGLGYRQLTSHLDLAWLARTGRVELGLFAGPALVNVEADLVESVSASESYPYDEAGFASATATARSASALGWSAGVALAGGVSRRLDLGVQARFTRATPELDAPDGDGSVAIEAGGLDVTAFLRLRF